MNIALTKTPKFIESSKTIIPVELTFDGASTTIPVTLQGTPKAYIEIYTVPLVNLTTGASKTTSTLTDTLERPFIQDKATFNIGTALHSLFLDYRIPTASRVQKDESSTKGYYLKFGYITYDTQNQQIKNFVAETSVFWVLCSAFNKDQDITNWIPNYTTAKAGKFLSNIVNNHKVHVNENVLLSAVIPKNELDVDDDNAVYLKGDFFFADGTSLLNRTIQSFVHHSGGTYTFNFKPSLALVNSGKSVSLLSKYTVWLEYFAGVDTGEVVGEIQNYTATESATVYCQLGTTGNPSTASATSTSEVSQLDATQKAYNLAVTAATAALVCTNQFASTKSAVANCPTGQTGSAATGTATRYSSISQADADTLAQAAAQAQAVLNLRCTLPSVWNATATATASCPTGQVGQDVTVTVYTTSHVSQADADAIAAQAALDAATAQLQCVPDNSGENFSCDLGNNGAGCFTGNMIGDMGTVRACTQAEGHACWTDISGYGQTCGTNPY